MFPARIIPLIAAGLLPVGGCGPKPETPRTIPAVTIPADPPQASTPSVPQQTRPIEPMGPSERLAAAAADQVGKTAVYDPSYVKLAYPGGDVPMDRGVCCDVVVRALRKMGGDLQVLIHEDMKGAFDQYPKIWGLKRPDPNIDHRRVPNIAAYFQRKGKAVPVTRVPSDYRPGDIVAWKLKGGRPHIGVVSNTMAAGTRRYQMVHNIGAGTQLEDVLFAYEITGHFRYF